MFYVQKHLQEIPLCEVNILHGFLRSSCVIFPLLLVKVVAQCTIYNSLLTIFTTSWQNLKKIGSTHNFDLFDKKKTVYFVYHFFNIDGAILKEVLRMKELMILRLFIIRLPSFNRYSKNYDSRTLETKFTVELGIPCHFRISSYL